MPSREPVACCGSFMMNTNKEILEVAEDCRTGKFWAHDALDVVAQRIVASQVGWRAV